MMRQLGLYLTKAALPAALLVFAIGCENRSDTTGTPESEHRDQASRADIYPTNTGGNGNTATTTGAGATNGVSGNETPGTDTTVVQSSGNPANQRGTTQPSQNQ